MPLKLLNLGHIGKDLKVYYINMDSYGQPAKFNSLVTYLIITLLLTYASASIRISVSAPINPLKEGGILSIKCQIWGLPAEGYQVTIFRTTSSGQPESISVDGLVTLESENTFLAERQMMDGSTVYLLSVIRPSKQEAGEYVCKIRDIVGILTDLPSDSIHLEFSYFPDKSDPVCLSDNPSIVTVGSNVTLTCSSEIGSPPILIEWKQGEKDMKALQYIKEGRVYSVLKLQLSKHHSETVFVCKVSSVSFPGLVQTCHYRLIVENLDGEEEFVLPTERISTINHKSGTIDRPNKPTIKAQDELSKCNKECSNLTSSRQIYWVISTFTIGGIALLFLILVLILYFRYLRANTTWKYQNTRLEQVQRERLYAELQTKQRESVVYMSLSRDKRIQKNAPDLEG